MMGNYHVRCESGENSEITSKSYLSIYQNDVDLYKNNIDIIAKTIVEGLTGQSIKAK